jgi:membrane fusion protein, multidrug efflux system
MKRRIFTLLLLVTALAGCKNSGSPEEKIFPVETERVSAGYIASTMTVMGTVDSKVHAWVQSTTEGSIQSLMVFEGNYVQEGQILCYIMSPDNQNMLGQARLEYERMKTELNNDTRGDDQIKTREAEKEYALAKNLFKPVPVVSPVSGTVISKTIENGSTVSVKQPLIEIADMNRLMVKTAVSEDIIAKLRHGQSVKVRLYAESEKTISGTISVITPGINFQTRTAGIEVAIPQGSEIRPGMTCSVEFVTASRSGAISLPLEAVLTDIKGGKRVFAVKEGKAVSISIVTGIENNTRVEILSGVNAGDEIVVLGQENLKEGAKVKMARTGEKEEKAEKTGKKK